MAKTKTKSNNVIMACKECKERNYNLPKSRMLTANAKSGSGKQIKLELSKYCPTCQKHTEHSETK